MINYYLTQTLCWLCCCSLMLLLPMSFSANNNYGDCDTQDSAVSHSQLYIKVTKGFDFEIDDDVAKNFVVQKMLFELHKLVRDSDIISVKKPSLQFTSESNGIYVFEFEAVNDINILMQQVQDLHFIDYARKVPIK